MILNCTFPLTINLPNASRVMWCCPQSHVKFLPYITALKWLSICSVNEIMWELIATFCPTLEVFITIASDIGAVWWDPVMADQILLKSMNNLLCLSVSKNISITLINNMISACPQLLHLMIDGKCTSGVDWDSVPSQRIVETIQLPPQLVCFAISSNCSVFIDVDYTQCKHLKVLNIPLLSYSKSILSLSGCFQNFIQSRCDKKVLVLFHQYETSKILFPYNLHIDVSFVVNVIKQPILGELLQPTVILPQLLYQYEDNRLIEEIMKSLFIKSEIIYSTSSNIKELFVMHLKSICDNICYVTLIENAFNNELISNTLDPFIMQQPMWFKHLH